MPMQPFQPTVMEQGRGKKVIVYKYKRKTGYHKKNGHRQAYTQVKLTKSMRKRYDYDCDPQGQK